MKYLLLIYSDEKAEATLSQEEMGRILGEYSTLSDDLHASGALVAGEALQPTETATTVRVRDGETLHVDGPFAETKEQLGGFYLIEAADLDAALAIAARVPTARDGSVEVRPVFDWKAHLPAS